MLKTILIFAFLFSACTTGSENKPNLSTKNDVQNLDVKKSDDTKVVKDKNIEDLTSTKTECSGDAFANVTKVNATGSDGNYQFSVTLKSPDKGCEQYANWWEVLDVNGKLVYRRILGHSHVDEQPFTRSGVPVDVKEDAVLYIRAHMNQIGYGSTVFKGSVKDGFSAFETECGFAADVETKQPLSTNCAF